ncbi:MAG: hypothetical protein ACI3V2_01450 [Faecousia sp.]
MVFFMGSTFLSFCKMLFHAFILAAPITAQSKKVRSRSHAPKNAWLPFVATQISAHTKVCRKEPAFLPKQNANFHMGIYEFVWQHYFTNFAGNMQHRKGNFFAFFALHPGGRFLRPCNPKI